MNLKTIHSRKTYAPETDAGSEVVAAADTPLTEPAAADASADEATLLGGEASPAAEVPSPEAVGEADQGVVEPAKAEEPATPVDNSGGKLDIAAITPPEGFAALDAEAIKAAEPTIRELGLDTAQTQQVVNLAAQLLPGMVEKAVTAERDMVLAEMADTRKGWLEAAQRDPEFGGSEEKLAQNIAVARGFRDRFFSEEAREILNASGLGDHPAMIRGFYRAGLSYTEDGIVMPDTAAQTPKTNAEVFYPRK